MGDLEEIGELLAARLVEGGLGDDVEIAAFGYPDCTTAVILVRPQLGEAPSAGGGRPKCAREVQFIIGVYVMLACGGQVAHRRIAALMSGERVAGSILAALLSEDSQRTFAESGYTLKPGVPRGFTFGSYNADESNAYTAQLPVTMMYCVD